MCILHISVEHSLHWRACPPARTYTDTHAHTRHTNIHNHFQIHLSIGLIKYAYLGPSHTLSVSVSLFLCLSLCLSLSLSLSLSLRHTPAVPAGMRAAVCTSMDLHIRSNMQVYMHKLSTSHTGAYDCLIMRDCRRFGQAMTSLQVQVSTTCHCGYTLRLLLRQVVQLVVRFRILIAREVIGSRGTTRRRSPRLVARPMADGQDLLHDQSQLSGGGMASAGTWISACTVTCPSAATK